MKIVTMIVKKWKNKVNKCKREAIYATPRPLKCVVNAPAPHSQHFQVGLRPNFLTLNKTRIAEPL